MKNFFPVLITTFACLFLASINVNATTLNWVSIPLNGVVDQDFNSAITAHEGYDTIVGAHIDTFTFNVDENSHAWSSAVEFFDSQISINSVILDGLYNFTFTAVDVLDLGFWELDPMFLSAGNHRIEIDVLENKPAAQLSVKVGANAIPVPGVLWLFGTGLIALFGIRKNNFKLSVT